MDVVLDTNVVVSASISRTGNPGRTIAEWQADTFRWVTSPPLLQEIERTLRSIDLRRYMTWDDDEIAAFFSALRNRCVVVFPTSEIDVITVDPDDNRILEAAVEGGVDYIVTGDRDLLDLRAYEGIEVVTPAEFVAILAEARNP